MNTHTADRALVGLGFGAHVFLVLVALPWALGLQGHYWAHNFPDGYDQIALNLLHGNGYRYFPDTAETLQRTPAYPFLLAGIFLFFGHNLLAAQVANLLFNLATAYLAYGTAGHFTQSRFARLASAAIVLFHPAVLLSATRGGVESMLIFSTALFLYALLHAVRTSRPGSYAIAGLALGFACVVKPLGVLFPAFCLLGVVVFRPRALELRSVMIGCMIMAAVMAAVMAPWVVRNYVVSSRFVPTMTILGISMDQNRYICRETNVLHGKVKQIEDSVARYEKLATEQERPYREVKDCCGPFFYRTADELEFNDFLKKSALEDYKRNPAFFAGCVAENVAGFWIAGRDRNAVLMNVVVQLPLLALALLGLRHVARAGNGPPLWALVAYIVYVIGVHVPVLAFARHSVQLVPALAVLAAMALLPLVTRARTRPQTG